MAKNQKVLLIIGKGKNKSVHQCDSHAEASKLMRGIFSGMPARIKDVHERDWNRGKMRSNCDVLGAM